MLSAPPSRVLSVQVQSSHLRPHLPALHQLPPLQEAHQHRQGNARAPQIIPSTSSCACCSPRTVFPVCTWRSRCFELAERAPQELLLGQRVSHHRLQRRPAALPPHRHGLQLEAFWFVSAFAQCRAAEDVPSLTVHFLLLSDKRNYKQLLGAMDYSFLCAYAMGMYLR